MACIIVIMLRRSLCIVYPLSGWYLQLYVILLPLAILRVVVSYMSEIGAASSD